jgi:hypothetical protein
MGTLKMNSQIIKGRGAIPGIVKAEALVSYISLQGDSAIDLNNGEIIQKGHPLEGFNIKGKVLVISGGRGSTGWSCRIHAATVNGVGPSAMIFPRMDSRTASAAAALQIPVVTDLELDPFGIIETGNIVIVDGNKGVITILGQ